MMICDKCGGTVREHGCNLCQLFESGHTESNQLPAGWPMVSNSMAVSPKQIEQAMALDKKLGVNVEYTRKGQPIFNDPGQRAAFARAHGAQDYCERNNTSRIED